MSDQASIELRLGRANVRVAELQQQMAKQTEVNLRNQRMVGLIKMALEEAIGLTARMQGLGLVDPVEMDKIKQDMRKLNRYFKDVQQNVLLVEQGFPLPESAANADTRSNIGTGRVEGDTAEEHKVDSRETPVGVDA